jgi:TonB-dependent starch-binding outer membrane protein SusC
MYRKEKLIRWKESRIFLSVLFCFLMFSANCFAQGKRVSLSCKEMPVSEALAQIERQSEYKLNFNYDELAQFKVTVNIKNEPIQNVIMVLIKGLPYQTKIYGKFIIIFRKTIQRQQPRGILQNGGGVTVIRGKVVDTSDKPLMGVNVSFKNHNYGVTTDINGMYTIAVDKGERETMLFSFIGMKTEVISVNCNADVKTLNLILKESSSLLDEVQVLAYGLKTSNRYSTGSSAVVTSEDIMKQPVGNAMQALQGKVAGVAINLASGLYGSDINVEIRGQNSIDDNNNSTNVLRNKPLYIIDGIAFSGEAINQQASSESQSGSYFYVQGPNGSGNGSPLSTINPNDIESIEVLKDASATALYGSRGANGVILIRTKRGKVGKPTFSVNFNSGVNIINTSMKALDLSDYLALRKEAFANDNKTPTTSNAPDLTLWSQTEGKNFKKLLIGSPAKSYSGSVSMSGGTNGITFMLSGNYSLATSVFDDNRSSNSYGFHFSSEYTSPNEKFKVSFSTMMGTSISNLASAGFYEYAYSLPPNFPLYNTDGSLYWWSKSIPTISNPLAALNSSYQNNMNSLNTSINLRYIISPGLNISINMGYNKTQSKQIVLNPSSSADPETESTSLISSRTATYAESIGENLVIEPQINYNRMIGGGSLTAMFGATYQKTVNEQPYYIVATGFSSDLYMKDLSMATSYTIHNGYNAYKYASTFGNINYIYKDRYVFNGNFRRDGSSKFGPNNRYANFGSLGLAWIFTNEKFLLGKPKWFSFGKIRSSYGAVGSDGIQAYAYLSTYSSANSSYYSGSSGLSPARVANPAYKWATSKKLEMAIDLGFLKDRLLTNFAYFRNRETNQLLQYPLGTQTGFYSYVANLNANVQNTGIEITLNSINIKGKNFTWSTSANLSFPQNKLISFPGLKSSSYASSYVIGRPTTSLYLLHYTGKGSDGKPTYQDVDKDGTITTAIGDNTGIGDLVYNGKEYPDFYGGLSNTFKYKSFQLDFSARFTVGAKDLGLLSSFNSAPGTLSNYPVAVVQAMRDLGLEKLFTTSTYSSDFNLFKQSDALLQKISYGRLTNVSLSYNLPENLTKRIKLSNMRIYVQGQNLFRFTLSGKTYRGIDPETNTTAVPPLMVLVGGISFSL